MPRGHLRHQITAAALPASRQDLAPPISLFRNGRESRETLPLRIGPEAHTATIGVLSRIHRFSLFRNGRELREMLPLWKVPETHTASTGVLGRIHRFPLFRNGSELRKTLPLWKVPETHTASTSVLSRIHRFSLFRNGSDGNAHRLHKRPEPHSPLLPFPQRQ